MACEREILSSILWIWENLYLSSSFIILLQECKSLDHALNVCMVKICDCTLVMQRSQNPALLNSSVTIIIRTPGVYISFLTLETLCQNKAGVKQS